MTKDIYHDLHKTINDLLVHHEELDKAVLAYHGLRRARFYTLRNIYNNPDISITQLSTLTLADVASTSRIVRSLEKEGLVSRRSDDNDRRMYYISLTDDGKALLEEANAAMQADLINRFENIDFDQLTSVHEMLEQLVKIFAEHLEQQSE